MEICNLLEREWKNLSHRRCTGTGITVYAREQGNVTMKVYKMNCCSSWTKWTILNKPKQNDKLWLYSPAVTRKKSLFLSSNNSCGKHLTNSVLNFDAFSNVKVQNLLHFQLFNIQLWYRFPATLFLAGDFYYLNSQWFSQMEWCTAQFSSRWFWLTLDTRLNTFDVCLCFPCILLIRQNLQQYIMN